MRRMDLRAIEPALAAGMGGAGEPRDQVGDLGLGQRDRLAELPARQAQLDRGGRLGVRVDRLHRLPPGMADLRPERGAARLGRAGPAAQRIDHCPIGRPIENDIAWPLKMIAIDMDIAR
jgi:hypothetical protein